jgi:hypothetical protein
VSETALAGRRDPERARIRPPGSTAAPRASRPLPLRLIAVAVLAVSVTACSSTPSPAVNSPSAGFGADSPWLGPFVSVALPALVNSLTRVDCATATRCWAIGETVGTAGNPNGAAVVATTDGGVKWASQVVPSAVGYLSGIACSDPSHCTAVGQTIQAASAQAAVIITTVDGGAVWSQVPAPPGILDLTAVTCRTDGRCIAIGSAAAGAVALVSAGTGAAWTQQGALPPNTSGASDISCTDEQTCWVTANTTVNPDQVAGTIAVTNDGGVSWSAVPVPTGLGFLNGISCRQGSVTGSGALPTTSTAATAPPAPGATVPPTTAAAPSTTATTVAPPTVGVPGVRCTVVGTTANTLNGTRTGHGLLLTTDNGGAGWSEQPVSTTSASLTDVSCTAIGSCVVVGDSVATSSQAGVVILTGPPAQPWKRPATVGSPVPLTAVSCISTSRCVVVGESFSEHLGGK